MFHNETTQQKKAVEQAQFPESTTSLGEYLVKAKSVISKFETELNWKPPDLQRVQVLHSCPYDEKHRVPEGRLEYHSKRCKWRKLGYSSEEVAQILKQEESAKERKDAAAVNYDDIISQIAPHVSPIRSEERYKCLLNPDQRLAVYNAEVAHCYAAGKSLPDKALYVDLEAKAAEKLYQKENPENLSKAELLQKLRDMKRRRQSYRAKNVHITKRSQTEIIKGVLEVHMEELSKLWNRDGTNRSDSTERCRPGEGGSDSLPRDRSGRSEDNRKSDNRRASEQVREPYRREKLAMDNFCRETDERRQSSDESRHRGPHLSSREVGQLHFENSHRRGKRIANGTSDKPSQFGSILPSDNSGERRGCELVSTTGGVVGRFGTRGRLSTASDAKEQHGDERPLHKGSSKEPRRRDEQSDSRRESRKSHKKRKKDKTRKSSREKSRE